MNEALLRAGVSVLMGAAAGGLTNTLAIWMLFHPLRPVKVAGWRIGFLYGAIPKNQKRLAAAIGRTVGTRLLTSEDLTRVLAEPEFKDAFEKGLARFFGEVLEVERGPIEDLFGPEARAEVGEIIADIVDHGVARIGEYLHSEAFEDAIEARTGELLELAADEPLGDLSTLSREVGLVTAAERWLEAAVESDRLQRALAEFVEAASERVMRAGLAVRDILPGGTTQLLERVAEAYVSLAIERLSGALDNPATRRRLEGLVRDLLDRFLDDLRLHKRVLTRLIVTEDTVRQVIDTLEAHGAEQIRVMFAEDPLREVIGRGIGEAIADLLDRPLGEFLEGHGEVVAETREASVRWLLGQLRTPATRSFLAAKLEEEVERATGRKVGEVLAGVPAEALSGLSVRAARSKLAERVLRESAHAMAVAALKRPLGRPARVLPPGAAHRIEGALSEPLWQWLQSQTPGLVHRIDIAARVEAKVVNLPVRRMEEIIRGVAQRELRAIVYLGYALGAAIGAATFTLNSLLS